MFENAHWQHDVDVVEKALDIVTRFNEGTFVDKPIKVNRATVWMGIESYNKGQRYLVEPFIEHWQKWNSNSGWAFNSDEWSEIMQALSHFSFHATKGELVLCDLQGGIFQDGAVISDPVILSRTAGSYGSVDGCRGRGTCCQSALHLLGSPHSLPLLAVFSLLCCFAQPDGPRQRGRAELLSPAPVQPLLPL